jgi:N-formylglutamate amidohydrolase
MIDGHSFPTHALPYEDDQNPHRPDICIGTDKSHTTDRLREAAVRTFEDVGWTVAVDRPFSGALVPMRFYGKDPRVRAIMVEVRRGLYMDERSGAQLARFNDVRARISGAVRAIVAVDASRHEGG